MEPIIEVSHIKKYYKEVKAVDDISFKVEKGELFGFLGVNGAGKSTTISMLCTLFPPTEGEAYISGFQLGKKDDEIRKRIGVVYQNNCLDDLLTVKENLMLRGHLYEKDSTKLKANLNAACELLELGDVLNRKFKMLSGGQKRRCEIARALMNAPEILFLDEPTTGLDPATRKSVWQSVEKLRKEFKTTVFLTTHYMEEAAKATHIAILDAGKLREYGTPFSLKENYAKDKLSLIPDNKEKMSNYLQVQGYRVHDRGETVSISVKNTLEALPLLEKVKEEISGFEVIQGSMDDVFLNVTGKVLVNP